MTITEIQELLKDTLRRSSKSHFGVEPETLALELPPKIELGDAAFPIAFELAKKLKQESGEKQNPRQIAESLKKHLEALAQVSKVEIAGPGYINVFYNRHAFVLDNAAERPIPGEIAVKPYKICVEHTSVNPNKAAHIGHVRNSVLGDTFQRILKATGASVEVQNYIDNTGVQVADVVIGFIYLENKDLQQIRDLDRDLQNEGKSFDYYCWDLYARVGQEYAKNEELKAKRAEVLHLVEAGSNPTAEIADYVATRNTQCITETMDRLSIRYDLLPRESEILHLKFWSKAFEKMKEQGVIRLETEGKNSGCWVMPFESHEGTDEHDADKILVRSDGTVTYTGKDIAYQMWKLGILGLDFLYKPFMDYHDGRTLWTTTADVREATETRHEFGAGNEVYNVIDTRQSYPQAVVRKGVAAIFPEKGEGVSHHLSYDMVALSPAAAEVLGFSVSEEDRQKPFIEMSGRKGLGVKADDLINRLEANALREVESRHAALSPETKTLVAHQLAVGALRFFLLKFTRNTIIVFDFDEALSTDGETGTFCQYSAVRANSIFRKLSEQDLSVEQFRSNLKELREVEELLSTQFGDDIWTLILLSMRIEETIVQAARQGEPAILAKYAFLLAKTFNLFYHNHKILIEENLAKKSLLVVTADVALSSLTKALTTLGISVPEKM